MTSPIDTVYLGNCGLQVAQLCFGTGTNGWQGHSNQSALGIEGLSAMLLYAHQQGVTFWDTADEYGTHAHVAAALQQVDRTTVTVATKTVSRTGADVEADVERFLRELNTDYLDIVLLHCLTNGDWPDTLTGAMENLTRMKERGLIRAVGTSCHDIDALASSATSSWPDVNLVRINYAGASMCASPDRVGRLIDQMVASGKGVYGMKVLGGGNELTADPAAAITYVVQRTSVHALVLGMTQRDQIDQNVGLVGKITGNQSGKC